MTSSMMPPLSCEQQRVLRLAGDHRREPAGEGVVEEAPASSPDDEELRHVRDVEQAGGRAHGVVLGEVGACSGRASPSRRNR